jgi:hypothetical protein
MCLYCLVMGSNQTWKGFQPWRQKYETSGLKCYRLDQRQLSLKMQGYCILIQEYLLRTKLCIYKCCCRYNRSTVFLFSKHPLKMIFMNCLLQNGHRSPCIPVHRKLMVVYRNLMSAYHKLRYLKQMFKGCIRMSDVIPLYILIYFATIIE